MSEQDRKRIKEIQTFPALVKYLREDLRWPVDQGNFEDIDDLTFDWGADELGIDPDNAAKIEYIKQLRPLDKGQPEGVFFIKFDTRKLPIVALRRVLSKLVVKKRATAAAAERPLWQMRDLVFISSYGDSQERQLSFAYFQDAENREDLPTLKVLGWDNQDAPLHLDDVDSKLRLHLRWPDNPAKLDQWRKGWSSAFTLGHGEVVSTSKELSVRLAKLAGDIRDRIKSALAIETDKGPLTRLMKAFQAALVHDHDADGFADMYAQTIAYGLLSARIADPHKKTADDFAAHMRTNPFLRELMETFLKVGGRRGRAGGPGIDFDELGVSEVVDLLDDANMEAVVRDFGDRNPQEDPVIHFYELFLKEYDAKKRMQRGVFYTPRPVVSYIVRSVDELLRTEFGLPDGLADTTSWREMTSRQNDLKVPEGVSPNQDFVQILDPATGTGTFLVEGIDVIHKTLVQKWKAQGHSDKKIDALWNEYVPKHLLTRLHGYELLMAPYAIAHLKIGLKLYETGYRFGSDERARVYLTNALEPAHDFSGRFEFAIPALAHEAEAVNAIKQRKRFTVVVGNPPYSGVSSNMSDYAQRIVDAYKFVDGAPLNEKKTWLQDDYVKFIRKAQMLIDSTSVGVVGYITNHSYLDNPTFRGMRQSMMGTFQCIHAVDLHGNTTRIEYPPDGGADKNVFDIQQGVAICLATRAGLECGVEHADLWGTREAKSGWLATHDVGNSKFSVLSPDSPYYFFQFQNTDYRAEYDTGWKLNEAMPLNCAGFITARDHFVVDLGKDSLLDRIGNFANLRRTDAEIRATYFAGCGSDKYPDGDTRGWKVHEARQRVANDKKWRDRAHICSYRPFDKRWIYWADWMVDWPRPEVSGHMLAGNNIAIHACRQSVSEAWAHVLVARGLIDDCYVSNKSRERGFAHPLYLYESDEGLGFGKHGEPNFASAFLRQLAIALNVAQSKPHGLPTGLTPEDILHYVYAVFHSPGYRRRYADFLKIDFPRVPLIRNLELFRALARLGAELVALHLLESPKVAKAITEVIGGRNPQVEKVTWSKNTVWIDKAQTTGFSGVREDVWRFHVGGYQVCEKWLKDRRARKLSKEDIDHYQRIVVALAETIRLMKDIDDLIERHGGWPGAFRAPSAH